jgi:predicted DCC family thiol-disulfide oxidoreductase YuxK
MDQDRIVLFDGVCNLCTGAVQFIIRRDRRAVFKFASLQSDLGRRLCAEHGGDPDAMQSILVLAGGRLYARSDAALEIAGQLDGPWRLAVVFKIVPRPVRDWVYSIVARNRYRWFGRREVCMMPTDDIVARFMA